MSRRYLLIRGASLVAMFLAGVASAADYVVLHRSQPVGHMSVQEAGDARTVRYTARNNGRGPDLELVWSLDSAGRPRELKTSGDTGIGVPPVEELSTSDGRLHWRSSGDAGQARTGGFYLPETSTPDNFPMLARVLRKTKDHGIDLLPAGRATLEDVVSREVSSGGKTQRVSLVLIHGVALGPSPIWLDAGGELFAELSRTGITTIRAGWEDTAASLLSAQNEVLDRRDHDIAKQLGRKPTGATVFRHVDVFDAEAKVMRRNMRVVIAGNRISQVAPDDTTGVSKGEIDGTGRTLMPGLWDMHVHLRSTLDGLLHVANGVLAARDMGNDIDAVTRWRKEFNDGTLIGPRLALAGLVDGRAATSNLVSIKVTNASELTQAIETLADRGYDELKIYSSVPVELLPQAVKEAHAHGLRVGGHVPAGIRFDDVVRVGFDDVSHLNFAVLNFLPDEVQKQTNTLNRMLLPAKLGATIDLDSPAVTQSIKNWCERGITLDATAIVLEALFTTRRGEVAAYALPYVDRLPPTVVREAKGGGLPKNDEERAEYTASFKRAMELLRRFHACGGRVVPGTDGMAGLTLPHELELYVAAGISPLSVLQLATLEPARMMKRDRELGSIAEGKLADVFLVRGDPSIDIGNLRNIELIVRDGTFYDPAALDRAIGMKPRKP
ncbi:amidohydrolase family protein [Steroidobacter flavus]|uniref:Amidohydrolase family protein n=1 Tax=Steroidobacter flavus TaxID=1842136 RepID=A0ABV8SM13_9GAMM